MPSEKPGEPISEQDIERRLTSTTTAPKLRIISAGIEKKYLRVHISDGRVLNVPLGWYPTLYRANEAERMVVRIIGAGYGLEWPELDFHLSLEGMLAGRPERGQKIHHMA
jgi:hypothetical protein